jgi:hypothetical protein
MKGMMGRAVRSLVVGVYACLPLQAGAESIPNIVVRAKQAVIEVGTLDAQGNALGTGTASFIRSDRTGSRLLKKGCHSRIIPGLERRIVDF